MLFWMKMNSNSTSSQAKANTCTLTIPQQQMHVLAVELSFYLLALLGVSYPLAVILSNSCAHDAHSLHDSRLVELNSGILLLDNDGKSGRCILHWLADISHSAQYVGNALVPRWAENGCNVALGAAVAPALCHMQLCERGGHNVKALGLYSSLVSPHVDRSDATPLSRRAHYIHHAAAVAKLYH